MRLLMSLLTLVLLSSFSARAQYSGLHQFDGVNTGKEPYGDLTSDGTYLYGMTAFGGTNDYGTIFKIMPDGTGFQKIFDFTGATTGRRPYGSLFFDGTYLYGMTSIGGVGNKGVIFRILPDGTGYEKLLDFNGATNGAEPAGNLISDGSFLYGMTSKGGLNGSGVIFKIMPDGSGYLKLLDFDVAVSGGYPYGSLMINGAYLYGMTSEGGTNNYGKVFRIMPDGSGFTSLHNFSGSVSGSYPYGSLVTDGIKLYGMTYFGGTYDLGVIFRMNLDGTGFVKMLNFSGSTTGSQPFGSLILSGTELYGLTSYGGVNGLGTLFTIASDGTSFAKLVDFNGTANGSRPQGSLYLQGTYLYGMTYVGGANAMGTIFNYNNCDQPDVVANASETLICEGESVTLTGSGATSYVWDNGITDGVPFTPFLSGVYTVTGTDDLGCSATDFVVVTVTDCAGLAQTHSASDLCVYPNPADEFVYLEGQLLQQENYLSIYNTAGELVWQGNISALSGQKKIQLDVSFLPTGVYLVDVNNYRTTLVKR